MELSGKVAVITGGGTGIGKAIATLFAQEGAKVMIAGRREEPLRQTCGEITTEGGEAEYVVTDASQSVQVQGLFEQTAASFGKIDILVNNAAVFVKGKQGHEFSEEEWETVLNTNLKSVILCSRYAIPYLKQNGGVILNVTSVSAHLAQRLQMPYNVSKAAVEMLSKCMALELGPSNVRVNTICPSMTETDMAALAIATKGREAIGNDHPLRRMGQPMDSAQAALYLASDRASWVSGNSLFVDGGITSNL